LLIILMIRWYKRGYYQNINKMVNDSPKAAIHSSVLSAIIFAALWVYGKLVSIDILILFPVIIFPVALLTIYLLPIIDVILYGYNRHK